MSPTLLNTLRGAPGYNAVGASENMSTFGAYILESAGANAVGAALRQTGMAVTNVKKFGAKGDGATDDSAAIQAAIDAGGITFFPAGIYIAHGLVGRRGMHFVGVGNDFVTGSPNLSLLRCNSGVLMTTPGTGSLSQAHFTGMAFDASTGGTDLFTGLWSVGAFVDCAFVQLQNGAGAFNVTGWIDMMMLRCTFDHTHTATVPTFKGKTAVGEIAQASFLSCRFSKSGDYSIHLEGISGSVIETVTIRDVNFEEPKGGAIRLLSARNSIIESVGMWDFQLAGAATKHLIHIGASVTAGAISSNNEIRQYLRDASDAPAGSIYDINLEAATVFTTVSHARHQINSNVKANFNNSTGLIIGDNLIADNAQYATRIQSFALKAPVVTTAQRPLAPGNGTGVNAGVGAMVYDTTLGKPVWSNGTVWQDASGPASNLRIVTSAYTVDPAVDGTIVANGTSLNVTLPLVSAVPAGYSIRIINKNSSAAGVLGQGGNLVNGASFVTQAQWTSKVYTSTGTEWIG
jgi:hypothetical protein